MERQKLFVTFRFAEEGEIQEIKDLINKSYEIEVGNTGIAFRKSINFFSDNEFDKYLNDENKYKWYLAGNRNLDILAASCFSIDENELIIHFFAVTPSHQNQGIGSSLLESIESIAKAQNLQISITISQWRNDIISWCLKRKYKENGGGIMQNQEFTRPTRYLTLKKRLNNGIGQDEMNFSDYLLNSLDYLNESLNDNKKEIIDTVIYEESEDKSLEDLMKLLLVQLRT